jgi:hypothetical protein
VGLRPEQPARRRQAARLCSMDENSERDGVHQITSKSLKAACTTDGLQTDLHRCNLQLPVEGIHTYEPIRLVHACAPGAFHLGHRIVMAPLTRMRSTLPGTCQMR